MGRKKALIIAISEYDNDYPLKYCEKDGTEVYKLLSSPQLEYEIEKKNKLIGRVKSEEMKDAIVDFFQNDDVKPEDMLLFYYSGHGIPEGVNTYLSPSEIDPKLPIKRGFSFKDLRTVVEDPRSVSGRKVVILDCCFSGSAEIGKGKINNSMQLIESIKEDSEALEQGEGICILAASQPYQGAYSLEEQGHSIFTYYLLEGLRNNEESIDSNGNVTPYSLNRYISKKINSLPAEKRPRQKPLMRSETSGEIILASYPKKPPPIMTNSPTQSSEAEVREGILGGNKSKILIGGGIAGVVAVVLTLALFNQSQQTLLNSRNSLYYIGDDLFGQGNYTGAITYLDKALKIDPKYMDALKDKGEALNYLGNYTQAIQILDKALAIKPKDESALNDRGYALNGLGKYQEAISYLDRAIFIDPEYKWPLYNKAYALNSLGKYQEAISYLDQALAIDRNFGEALNFKGAILDRLGNGTKFLQYENSTYGIKMQYPSDWILSHFIGNTLTVASFSPPVGDYATQISVLVERLTAKITPDQYLNKVMRRDVADYKYLPDIANTTNNIVLAGHPGYLLNVTYRDPTSNTLQRSTNIGTIIGDKAYSVIYYSPAYTYPVYLPTFTKMIKSFEVIPQKN